MARMTKRGQFPNVVWKCVWLHNDTTGDHLPCMYCNDDDVCTFKFDCFHQRKIKKDGTWLWKGDKNYE